VITQSMQMVWLGDKCKTVGKSKNMQWMVRLTQ